MSTRHVKPQGLIELPSNPRNLTRLRVVVEGDIDVRGEMQHRKKTMILTTFEKETSVQIYIGSQDVYCIDAQLYRNSSGEFYEGLLSKARYDPVCSVDEPFEPGTDTLLILQFLFTYVSDHYPTVRGIFFTDTSTKKCEPQGGQVSLAMMKVMMDGKTWYESHFDVGILDRQAYDQKMERMQEAKEKMSAEEFMIRVPACALTREEVAKKYSQSRTWQEFFTAMKGELGMGAFCHWLAMDGWFERFVRYHLTFAPEAIGFHFTPQRFPLTYQTGPMRGGARTRRRRRL